MVKKTTRFDIGAEYPLIAPVKDTSKVMVETIAQNLSKLAASVNALLNGPLKKRTIIVLLASSSGMSQTTITNVLDALENLEKDWLNPGV